MREGIEKKDAKGIIGTMYQNGLPDDIRVYSILNGNVNDLNRRTSSVSYNQTPSAESAAKKCFMASNQC
jgi:hypothetical protein